MDTKLGLCVENASCHFGTKKVLYNVNLQVFDQQTVCIVGPSGSGKSTLLRALLGTHPPQQGKVFLDGEPVLEPSRKIGIVYQQYSLFDFLTAQENVAYGLMLDRSNILFRICRPFSYRRLKKEWLNQAAELLDDLGLAKSMNAYPTEMSGGMRQRVAIAQAIIMNPRVLLLDEPFGALDEATREDLQNMIIKLEKQTIVMVTHELNEAIYVSDRVVGLSQFHADGENGATIIYDKPATAWDTHDSRDFSLFVKQKDELRDTVFNPNNKEIASKHVVGPQPKLALV